MANMVRWVLSAFLVATLAWALPEPRLRLRNDAVESSRPDIGNIATGIKAGAVEVDEREDGGDVRTAVDELIRGETTVEQNLGTVKKVIGKIRVSSRSLLSYCGLRKVG